MSNPIDALRTVGELQAHRENTAWELTRAERAVEYLTERLAEIDAALKAREATS